jgi:hypothetical protein
MMMVAQVLIAEQNWANEEWAGEFSRTLHLKALFIILRIMLASFFVQISAEGSLLLLDGDYVIFGWMRVMM